MQSRRDLGRLVTIADRNLPILSSVLAVNETGMEQLQLPSDVIVR